MTRASKFHPGSRVFVQQRLESSQVAGLGMLPIVLRRPWTHATVLNNLHGYRRPSAACITCRGGSASFIGDYHFSMQCRVTVYDAKPASPRRGKNVPCSERSSLARQHVLVRVIVHIAPPESQVPLIHWSTRRSGLSRRGRQQETALTSLWALDKNFRRKKEICTVTCGTMDGESKQQMCATVCWTRGWWNSRTAIIRGTRYPINPP
jgi:hypothetical protein